MRVVCVAKFFGAVFICLTLTLGISLTKAESSEPLASEVASPVDLKKDIAAAVSAGSGPTVERPVIGATQPPSPLSWETTAGPLFLHREKNDKVTLFTDGTGTELLNARDVNLGFGFGLDAGLGVKLRTLRTAFGAEVRYFGIYEWSESDRSSSTTGVLNRNTLTILYSGTPADPVNVTAKYESTLQNLELNLGWYPIERIRVFVGGRYINIDEELKNGMVFASGIFPTTEKITAKNNLLGGQLGVGGVFLGNTDDGFSIGGWAKVGYFNNDISTKARVFGPFAFSSRSSKDKAALATGFGIGVKYAFSRNIAFSARYQFLWLDEVAFAPQQVTVVDYINGRFSAATDSVLYQGGWIGVILSW
jgi:opacity protein-like surface antigen